MGLLPAAPAAFFPGNDRTWCCSTACPLHAVPAKRVTRVHQGRAYSKITPGALQVWDLQQCKCRHTLTGHTKPVQRLVLSGNRLYSTAGSTVRVWDLQTLQCLDVLRSHSDGGSLCGLALDGAGFVYVGGQVRPVVQSCPSGVHDRSQRPSWPARPEL